MANTLTDLIKQNEKLAEALKQQNGDMKELLKRMDRSIIIRSKLTNKLKKENS